MVKPETSLMTDWMSLLGSWLPFLLLIAVWFWLSRKSGMQARGKSGTTMIDLYEQQVAESRRMNVLLERIAVSLEKR
jgi:ATP-dependent Zn protease